MTDTDKSPATEAAASAVPEHPLAPQRRKIDELDVEILKLLNARTEVVEEIGRIKRELAMPVYEPKREDSVMANVLSHNDGPLDDAAVRRIFERIIDEMRSLQKMRLNASAEASSQASVHEATGKSQG
jgi:chorismate mutase